MVLAPGSQQQTVTQEALLLSAAERAARVGDGRTAIHLHLSGLRPANRTPGHIRIALKMMQPLISAFRGQAFLLSNQDVVLLLVDATDEMLTQTLHRLRALFGNDRLTFDLGDGKDRFVTLYNLRFQGREFVFQAMRLEEAVREMAKRPAAKDPESLDPELLARLLAGLAKVEIAPMIRRQTALSLGHRADAVPVFQEFFVYISELRQQLAPDVDIFANRWLFQHFSEALDQRMLKALPKLPLEQRPAVVSLNLNLATVRGGHFDQLLDNMRRTTFVAEVQVIDIFADIGTYILAREKLHEAGHRILVDGLAPLTLQLVDVARLDADYYKLAWGPELKDEELGELVRTTFGAEMDKVVLMRCDSEASVQWGLAAGIDHFQGRFVDAMLSAVRMVPCPDAKDCTLPQCMGRHGAVDPKGRNGCTQKKLLDGFQVFNVPKRKAPAKAAKRPMEKAP